MTIMTNEEALKSLTEFTSLAEDLELGDKPELCEKILAVLICERKVLAHVEDLFPLCKSHLTLGSTAVKLLEMRAHELLEAKAALAKARGE